MNEQTNDIQTNNEHEQIGTNKRKKERMMNKVRYRIRVETKTQNHVVLYIHMLVQPTEVMSDLPCSNGMV